MTRPAIGGGVERHPSSLLVGREQEQRAIGDALARASEGTGACLLIAGEAGIGKSRLLSYGLERAESLGFELYQARAEEIEQRRPFGVMAGQTYSYFVLAQNDSRASDRLRVHGTSSGSASITVQYFVNGVDRTAAIAAGTFVSGNKAPRTYVTIEVRVIVGAGAGPNASNTVLVEVLSDSKPTRLDVVRAITSR